MLKMDKKIKKKKEKKASWIPIVLLETKMNENFMTQNALAYLQMVHRKIVMAFLLAG